MSHQDPDSPIPPRDARAEHIRRLEAALEEAHSHLRHLAALVPGPIIQVDNIDTALLAENRRLRTRVTRLEGSIRGLFSWCWPNGSWRGEVNMRGILGQLTTLRHTLEERT